MAQANSEEKVSENPEMEVKEEVFIGDGDGDGSSNSNNCNLAFRFNAQAPEFFPRTQSQVPVTGYFHPYFHFLGGGPSGSDWFFFGDQEPAYLIPNPSMPLPNFSKTARAEDIQQKIAKQAEYQLSDMSLLANETLAKLITKDPDGYVMVSVLSATKKMKSLSTNHNFIVQALRSSPKLTVSSDGKKVRRKVPFTEKDKEELLARTVVAENLPENHSHHNLEKIFSVIGSVKSIRICHPPESNPCCSKGELFVSNKKLHALVEYENGELAERASERLNDERNWRKGLRVRLLVRRSPKSVLKSRKSEFDSILDDDDSPSPVSVEETSLPNINDLLVDCNYEENSTSSKRSWGRGRGKGRGRIHSHLDRSYSLPVTSSLQASGQVLCEASTKFTSKGPRMPDGTKGFTMGRGKPLSAKSVFNRLVD